jgi:hypothetical protein
MMPRDGRGDSPDASQHNDFRHISSMESHSHFNRKKIYENAPGCFHRRKINRVSALGMAKKTQRMKNYCGASRIFPEMSHISPEI